MTIRYQTEAIGAADFADILIRSGLGERRPVADLARLQRMLDGADIVLTARRVTDGYLVGIARSLTDSAYACYLSDLAVDRAEQGKGIGRQLIERTRVLAGDEAMLLLVSAPASVGFYERIAMPRCNTAFLYPRRR